MVDKNGRVKGKGKRRIWELQSYTLNKILGLYFDETQLRKAFKEMKTGYDDHQVLTLHEMHQHLVQICRTQSPHAKRVEKLLEEQFTPYKKGVVTLDPQELCAFIEGENRTERALTGIPIAALIWFAARNGDEKGVKSGEFEARISTAIQLREYQALRFYDELSRNLPEPISEAADIIKVLNGARESNVKLQRRCERLEQKKEALIAERDTVKAEQIRLVRDLDEQKRLNERLVRKVEELGSETAFEEKNVSISELEFFRDEIKRLNRDNAELMRLYTSESRFNLSGRMNTEQEAKLVVSTFKSNDNPAEIAGLHPLRDVRVAYIGGVESLESCYKELAGSFGCPFCYHGGHCDRGKREIEGIVERNDVVICPVDINSHNACRMVKEACKLQSKPCYFLRSSGLSALKKSLLNLAAVH
ncbi:MAG: DUF2325 domain-containing protein [Halobacteriota archaeon]